MLIKVTNKCSMGCTHCMEDSTIKGAHMSFDTFRRALDCTARVERMAWQVAPPFILLSGGECTEHPEIVAFVEEVVRRKWWPMLLTNGMWLGTPLQAELLRPEWPHLFVQVTNDPRFYPTAPKDVEDKRITFIPAITKLLTLGRAARKKNLAKLGVPEQKAPSSFNFRSATRSFGSIEKAVAMLRVRAITGHAGHCTPSICEDGTVVAGESRFCFKIGTVDSSNEELTRAAIEMRCNECGLVDNLTQEQKRAIGESVLFAGTEA